MPDRSPPLSREDQFRRNICHFFIIFHIGAVAWIGVNSVASDHPLSVAGTFGMFSAASMITGGFFGFLFGIPRSLSNNEAADVPARTGAADGSPGLKSNTNLEQISDWLTKILIGAGLAEFRSIVDFLGQMTVRMKDYVGDNAAAACTATVVTFFFSGFLWAYFESRTSLMAIFREWSSQPDSRFPRTVVAAEPGIEPHVGLDSHARAMDTKRTV